MKIDVDDILEINDVDIGTGSRNVLRLRVENVIGDDVVMTDPQILVDNKWEVVNKWGQFTMKKNHLHLVSNVTKRYKVFHSIKHKRWTICGTK